LLNSKAADESSVEGGRFVVQVGAFADPARAREIRLKLERAGLKTYTHVAETKDGKRTRVRVGPFTVKADAEKAAEKIKKLNLPAALLTL
jgi:DedD protein